MRKKIAIIAALVGVFIALFLFRPWEKEPEKEPRFFDRLPDADIIGKSDILDLSSSLANTLYHYKIPNREFLSPEFLLSQGKAFGIDLQKPAYFFANENNWEIESFGVMFMISDRKLIESGLKRLDKVIGLKDTLVYDNTVYKLKKDNIFIAHGVDWLLVYSGNDFKRTYHDVLFAKINEIPPAWRSFLNSQPNSSPIIAVASSKNLEEKGIKSMLFSLTSDTTSITLNTEVNQFDTLSFQIRNNGWKFASQEFTKNASSIHWDIERLRSNPNDPLLLLFKKYAAKISFPVKDFLNAWEGDLSFRQGGIQHIQEKYIVSELDDNFNVTEVTKYRTVKVPGYSVYLSMNENQESFLNRVLDKGILTKTGNKYRMLFSPPLLKSSTDSSLIFHTGKFLPMMYPSNQNQVDIEFNKTPYSVFIDSTSTKTLYGRFKIPLDELVKKNLDL